MPGTSAAGALTRAQAKVSPVRHDGRFAIAGQPSQSTLFAQVGCVQAHFCRIGRDSPTLSRVVCTLHVPPPSSRSMRYWPLRRSARRSRRSFVEDRWVAVLV
jgi:hypothetical protein